MIHHVVYKNSSRIMSFASIENGVWLPGVKMTKIIRLILVVLRPPFATMRWICCVQDKLSTSVAAARPRHGFIATNLHSLFFH
jgi:hypothetical protein